MPAHIVDLLASPAVLERADVCDTVGTNGTAVPDAPSGGAVGDTGTNGTVVLDTPGGGDSEGEWADEDSDLDSDYDGKVLQSASDYDCARTRCRPFHDGHRQRLRRKTPSIRRRVTAAAGAVGEVST